MTNGDLADGHLTQSQHLKNEISNLFKFLRKTQSRTPLDGRSVKTAIIVCFAKPIFAGQT